MVLAGRRRVERGYSPVPKRLGNRSPTRTGAQQPRERSASRGQVNEAIDHFRRALQINPDIADVHLNLGIALAGRQPQTGTQIDEAIDQFRKALEIKPDDVNARKNLGVALAARRRIDEAINRCRKTLEIAPDDFDTCTMISGWRWPVAGSSMKPSSISRRHSAWHRPETTEFVATRFAPESGAASVPPPPAIRRSLRTGD